MVHHQHHRDLWDLEGLWGVAVNVICIFALSLVVGLSLIALALLAWGWAFA